MGRTKVVKEVVEKGQEEVEGGGRGAVCGLWLEGRVCSMLTVMLGGDLDVATVKVRGKGRARCFVRVRGKVHGQG